MQTASRLPRHAERPASTWLGIVLFAGLVALSALGAIVGGLARVGALLPGTAGAPWLADAMLFHAALMIGGFMATVIFIERAVAVKLRAAWLAPLASGLGGLCYLTGHHEAALELHVASAIVFCAVNLVLVRRQAAAPTWLLLASALAWLIGNLLAWAGKPGVAVLPWWFAFLVMTIAAERLEMTRLMRRRPAALTTLCGVLAGMLLGAGLSAVAPREGGVIFGVALFALALWLGVCDIARRTLFAHGLSRYMAVCLLGGYGWLAVAGIAWAATASGLPARDVALHALGLGFVVSMMMGHAPVILPALTRTKLQFGNFFYVPLAALHLSLLVRLGFGLADADWRADGAILNAVTIGLFAATVTGAAIAWRIAHSVERARRTPA